jgi:hypothetical protein
MFLKLKIHWMNGCDFNLLCYGRFKIPKKYNYLKNPFKHSYIYKSSVIFFMSYNILIWNWKWKKMLLSISYTYSYFKPIVIYTKKRLWKWTLIYQNCDTLMCFCPMTRIVGGCVGLVHALGTSKSYFMIQERVFWLLIIYIIIQDHKIYLWMCIGLFNWKLIIWYVVITNKMNIVVQKLTPFVCQLQVLMQYNSHF